MIIINDNDNDNSNSDDDNDNNDNNNNNDNRINTTRARQWPRRRLCWCARYTCKP